MKIDSELNEERFRKLFQSSPASIAISKLEEGRIIDVNDSFTRIFGYSRAEVIGRTGVEVGLWESPDQRKQFIHQIGLQGNLHNVEQTIRTRWGEARTLLTSYEVIWLTEGALLMIMAVDITEQMRAQIMAERQYEAERSSYVLAETLRAAGLAISQSLELNVVLDSLLDCLYTLTSFDTANVMVLSGSDTLLIAAAHGYGRFGDYAQLKGKTISFRQFPTVQRVIERRQRSLISRTRHHSEWVRTPEGAHVESWIGVPLIAHGEIIGLYSLDKAQPGFFTLQHLHLADALAGQAALSIANARLFEQIRDQSEQLRLLTQKVYSVQERERQNLSRELHDGSGQVLAGLKARLIHLETELPANADRLRQELQATIDDLDKAIEQVRGLSHGLRPTALDTLGIGPALDDLCIDFADQMGVLVDYEDAPDLPRFSSEINIALYRIAQEALTNSVKHGRSSRIRVALHWQDEVVRLLIEDNGEGFDPAASGEPRGFGLLSMRERAMLLGGTVSITSVPGAGTSLTVKVPASPVD